jgi:uncharacterized protein with HEPN domain
MSRRAPYRSSDLARDVLHRLLDMRAGIDATFDLVEGLDKAALEGDEMRYAACMYRILNVAEAAKNLPEDMRDAHPEINWRGLMRMGDALRHAYFRMESDVVWDTVKGEFSKAARRCRKDVRGHGAC